MNAKKAKAIRKLVRAGRQDPTEIFYDMEGDGVLRLAGRGRAVYQAAKKSLNETAIRAPRAQQVTA